MKWSLDSETNRDGMIHARLLLNGAPTGMVFCNTAELAHLRTILGLDPEAVTALEERAVAAEAREEGLLRRIDEVETEATAARQRAHDEIEKNSLAGVALRELAAQVEASVAAEEARGTGGVMTREECAAVLSPLYPGCGVSGDETEARDGHACAAAQHARDVARLRQVELDGWDLYEAFSSGKPAKRRPMKADWIWHQMANAARARFVDALSGPAEVPAEPPAPVPPLPRDEEAQRFMREAPGSQVRGEAGR